MFNSTSVRCSPGLVAGAAGVPLFLDLKPLINSASFATGPTSHLAGPASVGNDPSRFSRPGTAAGQCRWATKPSSRVDNGLSRPSPTQNRSRPTIPRRRNHVASE
ncbi:hypothetical protein Hte_002560 [Hypoxylon texense]